MENGEKRKGLCFRVSDLELIASDLSFAIISLPAVAGNEPSVFIWFLVFGSYYLISWCFAFRCGADPPSSGTDRISGFPEVYGF